MKCSWKECDNEAKVGKKYCPTCAKVARDKFMDRVRQSKADAEAKRKAHKELWERANVAGLKAANACVPTPMVVSQHKNPLDDTSAVEKQWYVPQGPCGFAYVTIRPATCSFARWLAKHKIGHKSYYGGWEISAGLVGNQSVEIKTAWASAVAKVLQEAGVKASHYSRMD